VKPFNPPALAAERADAVSTFKSCRSFWDFERAVRRQLRFVRTPEQEAFLEAVAETSHGRKHLLKEGTILWRARVGHEYREEEGEDGDTFQVECAYYSSTEMKPLRGKACDGRVNPKGISCLYLANREETAVSEVRPWIGAYVSVGQFKILRDVELIVCRDRYSDPMHLHFWPPDPTPAEIEKVVWSDIDRAFSEPMTRSDDSADYIATQILSELFKREGFGGVAYRSNFGEEGYNIALFDLEAADLINCALYKVDSIDVKFSESDHRYFVKEKATDGN
jgi:hypothetical protein